MNLRHLCHQPRIFSRLIITLLALVASISLITSCSNKTAAFPTIDHAGLSQTQIRIVELAEQEFHAQPPGTKYSEDIEEPWCADFISWVFKEAGVPLHNPNSGSWRIPGTFTLREYYEAEGRFQPADSGYTPHLGDVAIYQHSPIFGDHANIVLKVDNGVVTTVGGNENGTIRVYTNNEQNYEGLVGYGVLNESAPGTP